MKRITFVVLLACGMPASAARADTLLLAEKQSALHPVLISPKASDATKAVARELVDYLGRITDATFNVENGDGSRGIVLGTLAEFPNPSLVKPRALRNTYDGKEAFVIRTEPKRLLLLGATDAADRRRSSR